MSAPVANPAAVTAGQTPGANAWAQTNAAPATGFEALLAALFPTAQADISGILAGQAKGGLGLLKGKSQAGAQPGADTTDQPTADTSAIQAQLAALLAAQPAQVSQAVGEPAKPQSAAAPAPAIVPAAAPQAVEAVTTAPAEFPAAAALPAELAQTSPQPAPAKPATAAPSAADQPSVLPAAEPKAPPPAALPALPLAQAPAEPPPEAPAQPPPAATAALAANPVSNGEAKPAPKGDKSDIPVRAAAPSADPAPAKATLAETAVAAQPAQASSDSGHDQPPPDQHEGASSDQGAPDIATAPTTGPASAAHMIQAEAAAVAARGSPETVAKLAAQIVKKLDGKSSRFDIALDPAGLGKVDVKVEINAQGQMTAALNFDNAAAAAELKNRVSELRTALEQAGFDMSNSNLSFSFSGQGDSSGQAFAQRDSQNGGARFLRAVADDQPVAAPASAPSLLGSRTSGVDVRI